MRMSLYQIVTLPHKLVRVCYARLAVLYQPILPNWG